jgi:hypothetical protein
VTGGGFQAGSLDMAVSTDTLFFQNSEIFAAMGGKTGNKRGGKNSVEGHPAKGDSEGEVKRRKFQILL